MSQPVLPAPPSPPRYRQLDGLRGLAALMVALSHFVLAFQPALMLGAFQPAGPALWRQALAVARSPLVLLFSPEVGVAIFFVLSGFVLASSVTAKPAPFPELAVRRWIRLSGPVLLTSLPIWLWLATGFHPDATLSAWTKSGWLHMNYSWVAWQANALHLLVFQSLFDLYARGNGWWNAALWTMPIEFWGSLGLFAAYAVTARLTDRHGARLGAALLLGGVLWGRHVMLFAAGAALFEAACLWRARPMPRNAARLGGFACLGLGVFLAATPYYTAGWAPWTIASAAVAHVTATPGLLMRRMGAVLLVASALSVAPMQSVLAGRTCRFLGRVSFMLYLLHVPVLCGGVSWLVLRLKDVLGYGPATAAALPVFLVVMLPLSELATRLIDSPCIALAHRAGGAVRRLGSTGVGLKPVV